MASKNLLWGVGIAAVMYAAYRVANLKKSVEFFQYSLSGLKFRISKSLQPEIIFSIQVYNPNQTNIPVNDFFGVIKKDDRILASFKNLSSISLGGKETQSIDISAKINVLSVVMQIIRGEKINTLTIDAMLKTGFFDMPVKREVSLSSLSGTRDIGRMYNRIYRVRPRRPQKAFLQYQPIKNFEPVYTMQGSIV